jgi:uncharacterized integral membrane protein
MTWLRIFLIIIFVITFLLWAGQNLENTVSINNFKGNHVATSPLWILVLISVTVGMFLMGVLGIAQEIKDKATIRRLNKIIDKQQEELASLRNLPISDDISEEIKEHEKKNEKLKE